MSDGGVPRLEAFEAEGGASRPPAILASRHPGPNRRSASPKPTPPASPGAQNGQIGAGARESIGVEWDWSGGGGNRT